MKMQLSCVYLTTLASTLYFGEMYFILKGTLLNFPAGNCLESHFFSILSKRDAINKVAQ